MTICYYGTSVENKETAYSNNSIKQVNEYKKRNIDDNA